MSTKGLHAARASFFLEDQSGWREGIARFNDVFRVESQKLVESDRYRNAVKLEMAHLTSTYGQTPLQFQVDVEVSGRSLGEILSVAEGPMQEAAQNSHVRLVKDEPGRSSTAEDVYERHGTQLVPA